MSAKLEALKTKLAAFKATYLTEAKAVFNEELAPLWERCPDVRSFGWRQYTPYFNDGNTCEFSAHTDDPRVNGCSEYDEDDIEAGAVNVRSNARKQLYRKLDGGSYGYVDNPNYNPDHERQQDAVAAFLKQFDDEALEDMFGDHVEVTATRAGVTTEEYEHD